MYNEKEKGKKISCLQASDAPLSLTRVRGGYVSENVDLHCAQLRRWRFRAIFSIPRWFFRLLARLGKDLRCRYFDLFSDRLAYCHIGLPTNQCVFSVGFNDSHNGSYLDGLKHFLHGFQKISTTNDWIGFL
jgi:hypothetical protein